MQSVAGGEQLEIMRKKSNPLVSVIMPVYNAGSFLVPAIESILSQTYRNFELIVINDASTDKSAVVIEKYRAANPRKIKVITLKSNLNGGGDRCANLGIEMARGIYIARMDADDIAHPERLARQVAFLESQPKITMVGSNAYVINKRGKVVGEKIEPTSPYKIYSSYFTFHPMIHPTCMIRSVINGEKFKYQIEYSANNDYNTFFKLLCQGHLFANLPEKLLSYRIHGRNDTFVHVRTKLLNTLKIRSKMVISYGYTPTVSGVFSSLLQVGMLLIPERTLIWLYFLTKGIQKPTFLRLFLPSLYRSRVATLFAR
jgi:glycosyltransferase involved in cell wall biosynthesis